MILIDTTLKPRSCHSDIIMMIMMSTVIKAVMDEYEIRVVDCSHSKCVFCTVFTWILLFAVFLIFWLLQGPLCIIRNLLAI